MSAFAYRYNAANQRDRVTDSAASTYWDYSYDALGQVTGGSRRWLTDDAPVEGQQYGYAYDTIGNRTSTTLNGRSSTYTANALNQYENRNVPRAVDVFGEAAADASVLVNQQTASRRGKYFSKTLATDPASTPIAGEAEIIATRNGTGPNGEDVQAKEVRPYFLPETPEDFDHDADGNLIKDGRWLYTWDGENRLIGMETRADLPAAVKKQKLTFTYDSGSRRIRKQVHDWTPGSGYITQVTDLHFLYNGWNLVAETTGTGAATTVRSYTWGLDLSGTEHGAGGVGGLLFGGSTAIASAWTYSYDGNGNVTAFAQLNGLSSVYTYGPFGESISTEGLVATSNPIRFSTRYYDDETCLVFYGGRFNQTQTGRWISRDPIEEDDLTNLYIFASNDAQIWIDIDGQQTLRPPSRPPLQPTIRPPRPGRPPSAPPLDPNRPPIFIYPNDPPFFSDPRTPIIPQPGRRPAIYPAPPRSAPSSESSAATQERPNQMRVQLQTGKINLWSHVAYGPANPGVTLRQVREIFLLLYHTKGGSLFPEGLLATTSDSDHKYEQSYWALSACGCSDSWKYCS